MRQRPTLRLFPKQAVKTFYKISKIPKSDGKKFRWLHKAEPSIRQVHSMFYAVHKSLASAAMPDHGPHPKLVHVLRPDIASINQTARLITSLARPDFITTGGFRSIVKKFVKQEHRDGFNIPGLIFPKGLIGSMPKRHLSEIINNAYESAGVYKTDISGFFRNTKKPAIKQSLAHAGKKIILGCLSEALFESGEHPAVICRYYPGKIAFSEDILSGAQQPVNLNNMSIFGKLGSVDALRQAADHVFGYIIYEAARFNEISVAHIGDDLAEFDISEVWQTVLLEIAASDFGIIDPDKTARKALSKYGNILRETMALLLSDILKDVISKINKYVISIMTEFILVSDRHERTEWRHIAKLAKMPIDKCMSAATRAACPYNLRIGGVSLILDKEHPSVVEQYMLRNKQFAPDFTVALSEHCPRSTDLAMRRTSSLLHDSVIACESGTYQGWTGLLAKSELLTEVPRLPASVLALQGNTFKSAFTMREAVLHICGDSQEGPSVSQSMIISSNDNGRFEITKLSQALDALASNKTDNARVFLGELFRGPDLSVGTYISIHELASEPIDQRHYSSYLNTENNRRAVAGLAHPTIDINTNPIRRSSLINYLRHLNHSINIPHPELIQRWQNVINVPYLRWGHYEYDLCNLPDEFACLQELLGAYVASRYSSFALNSYVAAYNHARCSPMNISDTDHQSTCANVTFGTDPESKDTIVIADTEADKLSTAIVAPFIAGYNTALAIDACSPFLRDKCTYDIEMPVMINQVLNTADAPNILSDDTWHTRNVLRIGTGRSKIIQADYILLPYLGQVLKIPITQQMRDSNQINFHDVVKANAYQVINDARDTQWHTSAVNNALHAVYDYALDYYLTANESLPEGAVTSPLLANYVLAEILDSVQDQIAELGGEIMAYVDDISIVFRHSLPDNVKQRVTQILSKAVALKGLNLSREKTTVIKGRYKRELFGVTFLKYNGNEAGTTIRLRRCDHMQLRQQVHNMIKFVNAYLNNLQTHRTIVPSDSYIKANYPKEFNRRSHMRLPRLLNKLNGRIAWAMSLSPKRYAGMRDKLRKHAVDVAREKVYPLMKEITAGMIDIASIANKQGMDEIDEVFSES